MAKYQAPEGYLLDSNTGLYYTQIIAEDEKGAKSQVVTWFNADTGEYRQDVYPIEGSVVQASESVTSGLKPAPPEPELKITPINGRAPLAGGPVVATGPVGKLSIDVPGPKQVVGSKSTGAGNKKGLKVAGIAIAAVVVLALAGAGIWKFVLNKDSGDSGNENASSVSSTSDTGNSSVNNSSSSSKNEEAPLVNGKSKVKDGVLELLIKGPSQANLIIDTKDNRGDEIRGAVLTFDDWEFICGDLGEVDGVIESYMIHHSAGSDGSDNMEYFDVIDLHMGDDVINMRINCSGVSGFSFESLPENGWLCIQHNDEAEFVEEYFYTSEVIKYDINFYESSDSPVRKDSSSGTQTVAEEYVDSVDYDKDSLDYAVKEDGQIIPNGEEYGPNGYWIGCIYGTFLASPQTDFDKEYFDTEIWPCLRLYENGTYELDCSIGGDYWTSRGTYSYIDPKSEMDDIIVTLFDCSRGPGGGTGNAVVVFSDASDYPQFLSDGFGYMGGNGAPYWFHREGY
ncbi:MAG: hypothetical protein J5537_06250 [Lachnospiraceae bacterium]|nr:hypothetical protein [Lachnospiraceae bacterium]